METFIATVVGGLEDAAATEIESMFGLAGRGTLPGAVLFEGPPIDSPQAAAVLQGLNYWSRGLDRVGVLLASADLDDLDGCYDISRDLEYRSIIAPLQAFAIRARRHGEHSFGSPDIARVVGQAVNDAYEETGGTRLRVSLRDPDVILRAELIGRSFRLWLDGTGDEPLYRRGYRRQLHPAASRATLAYLMLRVAGWRGGPLLDPMAGSGTIPIEAALYARAIAPGSTRRPLPTAGDPGEVFSTTAYREPLLRADTALDILGVERYERHVQGAWLNLAAAGSPRGVRLVRGDAQRLENQIEEPGRYSIAVLNPPFGRRVGSMSMVAGLYRGLARSAAACGVRRIVTLAENKRLMADCLSSQGYRVVQTIAVLYGGLPAHVVVAELS